MSLHHFEIYPKEEDNSSLYFLELSQVDKDSPMNYGIFKRNLLPEKYRMKGPFSAFCNFLHPFNLISNTVVAPHLVAFETEEFLKFTVDALNTKAKQEGESVKDIQEEIQRLVNKIVVLQNKCSHEGAMKTPRADTGCYDPSFDQYWMECKCERCGKFWHEDVEKK